MRHGGRVLLAQQCAPVDGVRVATGFAVGGDVGARHDRKGRGEEGTRRRGEGTRRAVECRLFESV